MSSESVKQLESTVLAALSQEVQTTEDVLVGLVKAFGKVLNVSAEDQDIVLKSVMARQAITMDTGIALIAADHRPWLKARKSSIEPYYWDRYFKLLERQRWPRQVLLTLDRTTDEILDLFGNPLEPGRWARRGLVMGDVQSGKTGTYAGLVCKAGDAGYRLVILLSGTLENLRRQTQERMDAGFVGFDSSGELKRQRQGKRVGVGLIDQRKQATVFTSRTSDFSVKTVQSLGLTMSSLKDPALVVVKKNSRILKNLEEWLRDFNAGTDGKINLPILLVDDEADNASINTREAGLDPTAINQRIRSILSLFTQSTYVGFTATPFANIFVDPDTQDEMLGDDLFPRDFIYALDPPTNYFGPRTLFQGDEEDSPFLREIADTAESLPLVHRKEFQPPELPESLRNALSAYLVGNAIRDLRNEGPTHRSMLVNVSRFTAVQNFIEQMIHDELATVQNDVRNFAGLTPAEALRSPRLARLNELWKVEYSNCGFTWEQIQAALPDAVLPVETRAVNQTTGARHLDFRMYDETGLRVIAVGGNSLSRGLTLEGLFISYFHRNSKMYDTLLQMGRWFGYRDGYRDLCRIWLTQDAMDWYAHISEASTELRNEIRRMRDLNLTPADFGLQVRAHPDSLIVTARNKMRASREIVRVLSVSGQGFESVELPLQSRGPNWNLIREFVGRLEAAGCAKRHSTKANCMYCNVSHKEVSRFVSEFKGAETDIRFQPQQLAELIGEATDSKLLLWDVVIPNGSSDRVESVTGNQIRLQKRRVDERNQALIVSGSKRRVGSRGIEAEGVPDDVVRRVKERAEIEQRQVSDHDYRSVRPRPLLLLHILDAQRVTARGPTGRPIAMEPIFESGPPLTAIGLSFPEFADSGSEKRVTYRANLVKLRELFETEVDDEEQEAAELE